MLFKTYLKMFNTRQLEKTGRSYGYAPSAGESDIFIGTNFRVLPEIVDGKVAMGVAGQFPNLQKLTADMVKPGTKIMVNVVVGRHGLFGCWCFKEEWEAAENRLASHEEQQAHDLRVQQADEEHEARLRQEDRMTAEQMRLEARNNDPTCLEMALESGWSIGKKDDRQVIVHRKVGNRNMSKTFHLPRSEQPKSRRRNKLA